MSVGTLVVNEKIFPISRIYLENGIILFLVSLPGPQNLPLTSEVRIHAPDGSLILTAPWVLTLKDIENLQHVTADGMTHIQFPVQVESVRGWPRGV